MIKKHLPIICLAAVGGGACLVWLACLLPTTSNHTGREPSFDEKAARNDEYVSRRIVARGIDTSFVDTIFCEADDANGNPATESRINDEEISSEYQSDKEEPSAKYHRADEKEDDPERIAALKEQQIRKRFGVIFRQGKWIPTIGGGTNLVYITTGSLSPGRVGEMYNVQFQATSGLPPYRWRIIEGELPRGFSFDAHSGMLSGTPADPVATHFFIEVTDSRGARDVAEYILGFHPEHTLEIVTETLPAAVPGEEYFVQIEAVGGVPPYIWSATGALDDIGALVIDPQTGLLYGDIFASARKSDIPLIFFVSDAQLDVAKELVLHVRSELSILDLPSFSIRESDPIEFSLRATGGTEPYIWSYIGSLPTGIELLESGFFRGKPAEPGLYEIGVWVQDAEGQVDAGRFIMEVLPVCMQSVSNFEAMFSRNSVSMRWDLPVSRENMSVRIVRNSAEKSLAPSDGVTVYHGIGTSFLDKDVGEGDHYYTAFLEENGVAVTSVAPPEIYAKLPPDISPFADRVADVKLLHPAAFGADKLPDIVLGPPSGAGIERGSLNVVSLGAATNNDDGASAPYGGSITLEFVDNIVWNGPGADFTVFENVFYIHNQDGEPDPETRYMEPAVVSVSQDGIHWRRFKFDFSPRYHPDSGKLNLRHPYCYNTGFAGINPVMSNGYDPDPTDPAVSGGDSFDLSDVGLDWIRYVRIQSTGNRWLFDDAGDLVHHTEDFGAASRNSRTSGFDLDAVAAIWMKKVKSECWDK